MAQKSKDQLKIQNDALFYNNGAELIQGSTVNTMFEDIIDSLKAENNITDVNVFLKNQKSNASVSSTNTGIVIQSKPVQHVQVSVNGETKIAGSTINDSFYFKNSSDVVQSIGNIDVGNTLHYNSGSLGYVLDNNDEIILTYLA